MAKIMLFIDGTWLYSNLPRLGDDEEDFRIDFARLPEVLAGEVSGQLGGVDVDVVRTYMFGSYASNYDLRDEEVVQRRRDFFDMLREEYHYEVEAYPINFMGRRLRKADRDPDDPFEPKEKCVDISLAASMLYYAAIPYAYDIAIAVIGDRDFKPVLQYVRRLGKRVAIASIQGSCAPEYSDPGDEAKVKDFDIIWLNDLLDEVELTYDPILLECESPLHEGDRMVWTTFHPRKGQKFYCDECREQFSREKQEAHQEYVSSQMDAEDTPADEVLMGVVKKKMDDRGYGFIEAENGRDYFFHLTDLKPGLEFRDVYEGLPVRFEVKKQPGHDKAGAAQNVLRQD